jgi:hypothetical protein
MGHRPGKEGVTTMEINVYLLGISMLVAGDDSSLNTTVYKLMDRSLIVLDILYTSISSIFTFT